MTVLGQKLESVSPMLPAGGVFGALLPLLGLAGLAACLGDFGAPEFEKFIVAIGMFSAGVLMSRSLPVWREAKAGELELLAVLRDGSPAAYWVRLAARLGFTKTIIAFLTVCALVAVFAIAVS